MKKVYSKPEIVFESFILSQSIAAGCEYTDPNHVDLYMNGKGFAFTTEANCAYKVTNQAGGDGEFNGICYHVFSTDVESAVNLHNS